MVVVFYACTSLLTNVAFLIWFAAMQRPVYLFTPELGKEHIKKVWMQTSAGALTYLVTAVIGWWLPLVSLGLIIALFILWIVMSIGERNAYAASR